MEFKQFEKIIKRIEKHHEQSTILSNVFGTCDFGEDIEDSLVDILSEVTGDDSYWIPWWIYETDFGRTCKTVMVDEDIINIETIHDLWKLIQDKT